VSRNVFNIFQKIFFSVQIDIHLIIAYLQYFIFVQIAYKGSNNLSGYITTNIFVIGAFGIFSV